MLFVIIDLLIQGWSAISVNIMKEQEKINTYNEPHDKLLSTVNNIDPNVMEGNIQYLLWVLAHYYA